MDLFIIAHFAGIGGSTQVENSYVTHLLFVSCADIVLWVFVHWDFVLEPCQLYGRIFLNFTCMNMWVRQLAVLCSRAGGRPLLCAMVWGGDLGCLSGLTGWRHSCLDQAHSQPFSTSQLGPPFFACRPKMDTPPLSKILDPPVSRHVSPPRGEPGHVSPAACEPGHVSPSSGTAQRLPPGPARPLRPAGRRGTVDTWH